MSWFLNYGYATTRDTMQLNRAQRSLRRKLNQTRRERAKRDDSQDARLTELEEENESLHVCLSTLLSMLAAKGILSEEDWLTIAELTQDVEDRAKLELVDGGD